MITGLVYKTRARYGVVWEMTAVGTGREGAVCMAAYAVFLPGQGHVPAWLAPKRPQRAPAGATRPKMLALPPPPATAACLPLRGEDSQHLWHETGRGKHLLEFQWCCSKWGKKTKT